LDTFMFAFLVWALAAFSAAWDPLLEPKAVRRLFALTGVMLGLATACKWFAVIPWVSNLGAILVVRLFQIWRTQFVDPDANDWYQPDLWQGVRWYEWALLLGVVPLLIYFGTFIPLISTQKAGPPGLA